MDVDQLYKKELIPECKSLGYKPIRIDMSEPAQSITELMMEEITNSACMIADLSYARPSVYFEIGYAQGLGIPIILTCRKDHLNGHEDDKRVHFDLAQYKISFWSQNSKGTFEWAGKSMTPRYRLNSILKPRK
jgi:nucleoside 2-deoxyribosyltransferase